MPSLIPAVARTMAAFETFAHEKRDLSNKEMARLLNLPDSSCLDLMYTLHTLGYLIRTPQTLRYYPSGRWYEVARHINENDPLRKVAQETVDQLSERTDETVFFGMLDHSEAKIIATQSSRLPLRLIIEIGERVSLYGTALGKALLAQLPPNEFEARLKTINMQSLAPHTLTSKQALIKDIETSRRRGWFEAHDEGAEHVSAFAVAGDYAGQRISISIAGPSERINQKREHLLRELLATRASLLGDTAI